MLLHSMACHRWELAISSGESSAATSQTRHVNPAQRKTHVGLPKGFDARSALLPKQVRQIVGKGEGIDTGPQDRLTVRA